jgi:hypothetical protein
VADSNRTIELAPGVWINQEATQILDGVEPRAQLTLFLGLAQICSRRPTGSAV